MRIGVYTNIYKDSELLVTKKLVKQLHDSKLEFYIYDNLPMKIESVKLFDENTALQFDLIITIGGDGTILRIAKWCAIKNVPILGINLGKVGFLTEVELQNIADIIAVINKNNFQIEKRSLLKTEKDGLTHLALNEFVVSRNNINKMISLDVFVNNQKLDSYFCDGFIISTPTGSTAYSLSAGGPVISPSTNALALTPINSHSLHSRPVVISDNDCVEICLSGTSCEASIIVDGELCGALKYGERLKIVKATEQASFVRLSDNNFFSRLLDKLNKWSVTNNG